MKPIFFAALYLGIAMTGGMACAQTTAPSSAPWPVAVKDFASSTEVQALIAKARAEIQPGKAFLNQRLLSLDPYIIGLEYRVGPGNSSVHVNEAEMVYVIEGAGVLVSGGKLVGERETSPNNKGGDSISGGLSRPMAKGDLFLIPENTPHAFNPAGGPLVLMTMHVPRGR